MKFIVKWVTEDAKSEADFKDLLTKYRADDDFAGQTIIFYQDNGQWIFGATTDGIPAEAEQYQIPADDYLKLFDGTGYRYDYAEDKDIYREAEAYAKRQLFKQLQARSEHYVPKKGNAVAVSLEKIVEAVHDQDNIFAAIDALLEEIFAAAEEQKDDDASNDVRIKISDTTPTAEPLSNLEVAGLIGAYDAGWMAATVYPDKINFLTKPGAAIGFNAATTLGYGLVAGWYCGHLQEERQLKHFKTTLKKQGVDVEEKNWKQTYQDQIAEIKLNSRILRNKLWGDTLGWTIGWTVVEAFSIGFNFLRGASLLTPIGWGIQAIYAVTAGIFSGAGLWLTAKRSRRQQFELEVRQEMVHEKKIDQGEELASCNEEVQVEFTLRVNRKWQDYERSEKFQHDRKYYLGMGFVSGFLWSFASMIPAPIRHAAKWLVTSVKEIVRDLAAGIFSFGIFAVGLNKRAKQDEKSHRAAVDLAKSQTENLLSKINLFESPPEATTPGLLSTCTAPAPDASNPNARS
ncbi:MAG: hypothetical protein K0U12_07520 [Gammaproteobacteria bacterium]|nr:hypothetical protein [Gammaproteobacteria bacterium]